MMTGNYRSLGLLSFCFLAFNSANLRVNAQIIPDNTLGSEKSRVTPINSQNDRIDGGAIRGSNLFHSFREFNINEGHSAYFANPEAIQNIFSRVTGNNPSLLLGKLGVLGNANLFLINPNGIIFGQNASLDIRGSFVSSTANSLIFPNGESFSATNPNAPPLLKLNTRSVSLQFEKLEAKAIINEGTLGTGKNLALIGGSVVSTGQLSTINGEIVLYTVDRGDVKLSKNGKILTSNSQSFTQNLELFKLGNISIESGDIVIVGSRDRVSLQGKKATVSAANNLRSIDSLIGTAGDLNLLARGTVFIRDSIENPFLAVSGKNLVIEGKQGIDIFALNNSASELISGKGTILRSDSAVLGDAHFWSGRGFQVEKLDGSLEDLVSPNDPIIRSQGDVSIDVYQGASLHILAGGKVNIETVVITDADTQGEAIDPVSTPNLANITLSDGTQLTIDGKKQPTLDIRAGMNSESIGKPLGTIGENSGAFFDAFDFPVAPPQNNPVATSADITIGEVLMLPPDGLVLLTNQYKSNRSLSGGDITITGVGAFGILGIDASGIGGKGSDVILDSRRDANIEGDINAASEVGGANLLINAFRDVNITDSTISVRGSDRGIITINANNLNINGEITRIRAGIEEGLGTPTSQAGDININVADTMFVSGSVISNVVNTNAQGNAGDIKIDSSSVILADGAIINSSTFGKGNAGIVKIIAPNGISLVGNNSLGFGSSVISQVTSTAEGNSGRIVIDTSSLFLNNGAQINASTFGKGNSGEIQIKATEKIFLAGEDTRQGQTFFSALASQVTSRAEGNSGGIVIDTGFLSLVDGTQINATTFGKGNAGEIEIKASEGISLAGKDSQGLGSGVFSVVTSTAEGNSGGIVINTTFLSLADGAQINATTGGKGNAGAIQITTTRGISLAGEDNQKLSSGVFSEVREAAQGNSGGIVINTNFLSLSDGTVIGASTFGKGNAGEIQITAFEGISLAGEDSQGFVSAVVSTVEPKAEGNSGGIFIDTSSLSLTDGALISSSTLGRGNAGTVEIKASNGISLAGENTQGLAAGIISQVKSTAEGNSEGIIIKTSFLSLSNGVGIDTSTLGKGNAGAIEITASDGISLVGENSQGLSSGVFSTVRSTAEGNSGGIIIDTSSLLLNNGSEINASTLGKGNAGAIEITASDDISLVGENSQGFSSGVFSTVRSTAEGKAGSIILDVPQLTLLEGTIITASTDGKGDGGNIIINSPNSILLSKDSTLSVETTGAGKPGDINISTDTLTIGEDAQLSATATATSTNTEGGGSITLNANNLSIAGKLGIFAETQSIAPAGDLIIQPLDGRGNGDGRGDLAPTVNIQFTDNGFISASTSADGRGGNITISAPQILDIRGDGKITVETSGKGNAGTIDLTSQILTLADGLEISASTTGEGGAGNINLTAKTLDLSNGAQIRTNTAGSNNAGDINLQITENLQLTGNNTGIFADTAIDSLGNGGNISIDLSLLQIEDGATVSVNSQGKGLGGNISISSGDLNLNRGTILGQSASNQGGNITLKIDNLLTLNNRSQISTTAGTEKAGGDGGNISIDANFIIANPLQNSDITANAFTGRGGNINITTQGILGLQVRKETTNLSDITASSEFGLDGTININDPGVDPTTGLQTLPQTAIEATVSQGCQVRKGKAAVEFYQLGKGGFPISPNDWLTADPFSYEGLIPLETLASSFEKIDRSQFSFIPHGFALSCQK